MISTFEAKRERETRQATVWTVRLPSSRMEFTVWHTRIPVCSLIWLSRNVVPRKGKGQLNKEFGPKERELARADEEREGSPLRGNASIRGSGKRTAKHVMKWFSDFIQGHFSSSQRRGQRGGLRWSWARYTYYPRLYRNPRQFRTFFWSGKV